MAVASKISKAEMDDIPDKVLPNGSDIQTHCATISDNPLAPIIVITAFALWVG